MIKYLIIDDHVVIRTGIKFLLYDKYSPGVIDEAVDGESAIARLNESGYDLVIMDIQMPNTDSLQLMEHIKTNFPGIKVLVYSMSS